MSGVDELPPSSKLVYTVLEHEGELTQREIAEETRLSQRTTREALDRLRDAGVVTERVYPHNTRQSLYRSSEATVSPR